MSKPISTSTSYWYITFVIVVLAGAAATAHVAISASRSIKQSLAQRTESMATLIPAESITKLQGSESDLQSPTYQQLKQQFIHIRQQNSDIRFIYILAMRPDDSDAFFYLDSEPPESEDYSPPGQSYHEGINDVRTTYRQKHSSVLPISRDRWGDWLSAFSPIHDNGGNVVGVLGMDVPAAGYYRSVAVAAAVPLLLTCIVMMGLVFARWRNIRHQRYLNEKAFYLSFASHEIVSPLTSVTWYIRAKRDDPTTMIPKAEASLGEILTTVNEVLSLQSLDRLSAKKLQKEPEQVSTLIDNLAASLSIVCEQHGVSIQNMTAQDSRAFSAPVDKLLFKRVLFNLLLNAIKYSPAGSTVTVAVGQTPGHWTVSVHNDGKPLSPDEQKRIFEGYYQASNAQASAKQGTGLGLMLSRDIIVRHGGTLEIASGEGAGVTLTITMPLA